MAKRHFLQQSHKYKEGKHKLAGKYLSEKLDGQRCFWDGGISRGLLKSDVPYANCDKDGRYLTPPRATGLWSRYGNVIHAPDWFLDLLPKFPLDGELWCGRGLHQETRKIISPLIPNDLRWKKVKFMVFDTFHFADVFYESTIDITNFYKEFDEETYKWILRRAQQCHIHIDFYPNATFQTRLRKLSDMLHSGGGQLLLLPQVKLSRNEEEAVKEYEGHLSYIMSLGGEGLVTRCPDAPYIPERVHSCVKHKPYHDSEGTVVGYVTGRLTDKGSKLLGLMGAMEVEWRGKRFYLSGFTDAERTLGLLKDDDCYYEHEDAYEWAYDNPETICPDDIGAVHFPRGSKVTFKYRELTDEGIPKEAAYLRKWSVE